MTQSELVAELHAYFPGKAPKEIDAAIKIILNAMAQSLSQGVRVEIRKFGSFSVRHRALREARNPKSGKKVVVPEKSVPYFKASEQLREQVNLYAHAEPT